MAGLAVNFEVLNQLNTPTLYADTLVNRPAAAIVGRIFFRTDSPYGVYRDTGSSWDLVASPDTTGITGTLATGQVPYATGTATVAGTNNLFWDAANNRLGINTTTPGVPLDIHTTGTGMQINGTGTNNAFLSFQNAGTGEWRIGNNYSSGTNYFSIFDQSNSIETIKINSGTVNKLTNNSIFVSSFTQTSIGNATTITPNSVDASFSYTAGVTRTGTFDFAMQTIATFNLAGTLTRTFGQMCCKYNQIFLTMAGNITMSQPSYLLPMSTNSNGLLFSGSGTLSHFAQILARPDTLSSGTITITNRYQLLLNNITGIGGGTYTNRWGIYQEGSSDNNYFAGKVLIGTTTVGTYALSVTGTTLHSGQTDFADAVNITTGTTTGSKIATATNQKIGFWNATPIVQPTTATGSATFVVNAGTAVNTGSTFAGYTIAQVVNALRTAGLLA